MLLPSRQQETNCRSRANAEKFKISKTYALSRGRLIGQKPPPRRAHPANFSGPMELRKYLLTIPDLASAEAPGIRVPTRSRRQFCVLSCRLRAHLTPAER
jgi:hypothetical protein